MMAAERCSYCSHRNYEVSIYYERRTLGQRYNWYYDIWLSLLFIIFHHIILIFIVIRIIDIIIINDIIIITTITIVIDPHPTYELLVVNPLRWGQSFFRNNSMYF